MKDILKKNTPASVFDININESALENFVLSGPKSKAGSRKYIATDDYLKPLTVR